MLTCQNSFCLLHTFLATIIAEHGDASSPMYLPFTTDSAQNSTTLLLFDAPPDTSFLPLAVAS